ncbi:MAG: RDD family protein [Pseudomonadota bacterium]
MPLLDSIRDVETPEGVHLMLRPAGPVPRFYAWVIDFLIRAAAYLVLAIFLPQLGGFGQGLFLILLFLMEWFYPVLFEVYREGMTPGKRAMRLAVIRDDGSPVNWSASITRNLLRFADFLPFGYGLGLASMLISTEFKRLGDLAAGTLVVHQGEPPRAGELTDGARRPPPAPLTVEEQRAVVGFAERADTLTPERAQELAEILGPAFGASGAPAVVRVVETGRWLAGRR